MSTKIRREEAIKQLALIEERKKRLKASRPQYRPRPGQLTVLSSKAKNIFNFSGNGGGKTAINVQLAMAYARGKNPWSGEITRVPAKIAFVVDTSKKIDERIVPEFKKWFELRDEQFKKEGRPYTSKIYLDNGSEIVFLTADADPLSFEAVEFSVVVVDEPFPRPLYVALKRSLRIKGHPCKFIFSGTAISEPWLRKEIFEPWKKGELKDTQCFTLSSSDNEENLAEGWLEDFGAALTEAEKKVRLEGGFFDTDSLALAHLFDPEHHVIPDESFVYDPRMPCVVAIDPHSAKPHTAVVIAVDRDDRIIAIKQLSQRGNAHQFGELLLKETQGLSIVDIVCDSLGNMELTSGTGMESFIESINNYLQKHSRLMVRSTKFKEKNHEDLIDRLRQGLIIPSEPDQLGRRIPKLRFLSSLKSLISDIETATFQKNRMTGEILPKIDTSTKDHLSCLGYALATGVFYDIVVRGGVSYRVKAKEENQAKPVVHRNQDAQVLRNRQEILKNRRARYFNRLTKR